MKTPLQPCVHGCTHDPSCSTAKQCAHMPELDGSDWGVPPETQAVRDARIRRETIEECAKVCDEENASRLALHRYATAAGALCCADRIRAMQTLETAGASSGRERRSLVGDLMRAINVIKGIDADGTLTVNHLVDAFESARAEERHACAQIVLREARRLRDEGDEYDQLIVEKLLVLAEAILK